MTEEYQKKSYTLFYAWLILLLAAVLCFIPYSDSLRRLTEPKAMGLMLCVLLCLLYLLIFVTQSVYWISGVTYEKAAEAGSRARRRFALKHLLLFLGATVLFALYCFVQNPFWFGGRINDSMAAAAHICLPVMISGRIRL